MTLSSVGSRVRRCITPRELRYLLVVALVALNALCAARGAHAQVEQAQVDLAGTWRAGATAIDVSIESWGEDCGARPGSTRSNGGGIVTVEQKGQTLLLHGRDQDIRTDACWSRNPAMKRSAASYSDGMWMTRCRTAADDPREELGIYTLTLQDPSTLQYKDVSHYDWSLNESKCVATFTTTQTLTRASVSKTDDDSPPLAATPAVTAEPAAEARGCRPGAAANISLRPKSAEIEVGERVCFKARVSDATDCVLSSPNVSYQLGHARSLRGTLSGGCFTAADNAADAEGEFRITAKSGSAQTEAIVTVKRMDLSSLIARRMENSGLSGVEEEEIVDKGPKAVARIATHTAPAEAGGGRSVLLVVLGVVALGLTAAGFWMIRKEPAEAKGDAADGGDAKPAAVRASAERERSQTAQSKERAAPKPSSQSGGEVWICPACRIGYPAEQTTCPKDGARLVPYAEFAQRMKREREQQARGKVCPTCGRSYPATAAFCGDDGASLVDQS